MKGLLSKFSSSKKTPKADKDKSKPVEKAKIDELSSKEKQRNRWKERYEERIKLHTRPQAVRSSKKGAQKGAFGKCKGPFDPAPAARPKQMKRSAEKAESERKAKNKRRK